ncbi:MAG: hypothetical protein GYB66_06075 [Chloroflexi bacterium]|nr:hypothetical protein [Chloroflexota bacterium]
MPWQVPVLRIRGRADHHPDSSGYTLRFKEAATAYDGHIIAYTYDGLARLLSAAYYAAGDDMTPGR